MLFPEVKCVLGRSAELGPTISIREFDAPEYLNLGSPNSYESELYSEGCCSRQAALSS